MRVWGAGFGIAVLVLFGRLIFGDADRSSATCPAVSVEDSFLGFQDWGFDASDGIDIFPVSIIEGGEVALQKALNTVHADSSKYVAVLFYASWCSFSRAFRPTFSILASLYPYPSISHLAIEESAIRPSILSKYGVHGFPALFILNSTMLVHYHGHRTLTSLEAFYSDLTGIQSDPARQVTMDKVKCLSRFDKTEEDCPFSWARSPENILRQETYLALATAFVLMRLANILLPYVLKLARFAWTRYMANLRPSRLWEHPVAYLDRLTSLFNSQRDPRKRHNLQGGAKAARTWASKSLASAVPIGEASTSRGTSLVEGQQLVN